MSDMAGHIQKRGESSWRLHAYVGLDGNGRRRYASKTFHGSKREAELALAAFVTEVEKERNSRSSTDSLTVSEVLHRWLDAKSKRISPSTTDRYKIAIKHIEPALGSMDIARLRPHHIDDLYNDLLAKGLSGSSIRKVHWAMRQSVAWAHRRGYCASLATDGVELPPLGERKLAPPSSDDVRRVVEHMLDSVPDWGALFALLAWTGCRRGEACGLRWEDVDFDGQSILIRRAVVAIPGGVQQKGTKTGEVRRIAIGPKTVTVLQDHHARCAAKAAACGAHLDDSAYVFSPDPVGSKPYNPHTITRTFIAACREVGVTNVRLHDLRHHSATTLLKNGASVGEVMDRHGWRTVEMVNRYRHLLEAKDIAAAIALENA